MNCYLAVVAVSGDVTGAVASAVVVALRTAAGRRLFPMYRTRKWPVPFKIVSIILRLRQLRNVLKFSVI